MKKWAIIGGIAAVLILAAIITLLYIGDEGPSTQRLRNISIIFISLFAVISTVLLAAITGALLWLTFTIRGKVIPLLETLTATVTRLKGTTEFVTEQAVTPVIGAISTVARIRAMTKTVTGGKARPIARRRDSA